MAVSIHKHYISSTIEDIERAAGSMLIAAKTSEDVATRCMCVGAAAALYAIANNDIKDAEDFKKVWALEKEGIC